MSRINWARDQQRRQIQQQGCEDVRGDEKPPSFKLPPGKRFRKRIPKAELRMIADAAFKRAGLS
jgi:hypothetical protein